MFDLLAFTDSLLQQGKLDRATARRIKQFITTAQATCEENGHNFKPYCQYFELFIKRIAKFLDSNKHFEPYHKRNPDYTEGCMNLFRLLYDEKKSTFLGEENVQAMKKALKEGENVILFANHQSEGDPYALRFILEKEHLDFANEIIWVAGERVITDPLAVVGSIGTNLFCIYSKRYMHIDGERKKIHNQKTMRLVAHKLAEGGNCIYVAPSGGRDRPDENGVFKIADFDPDAIEMFNLLSKKSGVKTHFHTLALRTFTLFPPPRTVVCELGEPRIAIREGMHANFGPEVDINNYSGDKNEVRQKRAHDLQTRVEDAYAQFPPAPKITIPESSS